jgi:hypothetical protein
MMSTEVAWADRTHIADLAQSLDWSEPAYVYLEQVPRTLLDETARRDGIRLEHYRPTTSFDRWQRGRIFDAHQELKWEQHPGGFRVIYCGKQLPIGFTPLPLHSVRELTRHYYLWGRRVHEQKYEGLGLPRDAQAFIELQVPRILYYPITLGTDTRVQMVVHELYAADGSLCYARWCGIESQGEIR